MERQLDLLKGPRQRGTVAPGPTEFQIHCVVADYLRIGIAPGWMWFHPPNGSERPATYRDGKRVSFEGGRLKRMGVKPGASDILLISKPHAQLHALELKRKGEKLTDAQVVWLKEVSALGGKAEWADSVDWALTILKRWGALKESVHI